MKSQTRWPNFRSVLLNLGSAYILFGFSTLFGIVVVPIVLNGLGKDAYGLMGSANSLWQYLTLLSLGTNTTVVRYIPQAVARDDQAHVARTISTFLVFNIGAAFVGTCLILIITQSPVAFFSIPDNLRRVSGLVMLFLGLSTVFNFIGTYFAHILIGLKRLYVHYFLQVGATIVTASTSIGLIFAGHGVLAVSFGTLAISFVFLLIRSRYVYSLHPAISLRLFDHGLLRELIVPSLFYFVVGIGSISIYQSGNILIGSLVGVGAVAIYAATRRLLDTTMGLLLQFSEVLVPYIAEAQVLDGTAGTRLYHRRLLRITFLASTVTCFILVVYGKALISLWLGAGRFIGWDIWVILCIWMFVHAITQPGSITIIAVGRQRPLALAVVLEATMSIALGIMLVQSMGVCGVALAGLAAAITTGGWFIHWFTARITGDSLFGLFQYAFTPGLVAVVPAILWQVLLFATGVPRETLNGLVMNATGSGISLLGGVWFLGFNSQERQKVAYFCKKIGLQFKRLFSRSAEYKEL